jgi:hypothetical protein
VCAALVDFRGGLLVCAALVEKPRPGRQQRLALGDAHLLTLGGRWALKATSSFGINPV